MTDDNTETTDSPEFKQPEDTEWFDVVSTPTEKEAYGPLMSPVRLDTREGEVVGERGDYVIRESDGNCYPISGDKFDEYYNKGTDEQTDDFMGCLKIAWEWYDECR